MNSISEYWIAIVIEFAFFLVPAVVAIGLALMYKVFKFLI